MPRPYPQPNERQKEEKQKTSAKWYDKRTKDMEAPKQEVRTEIGVRTGDKEHAAKTKGAIGSITVLRRRKIGEIKRGSWP